MDAGDHIDHQWVARWVAAVNGLTIPGEIPVAIVAWTAGDAAQWWARLADGKVTAGSGEPPEPATVTFEADADTAAAIHRAELAGEDAVLAGRLRVRGDVVRLAELRPALDAVAEAASANG